MEQKSAEFLDEYDYDVDYTNDVTIETVSAINVVYSSVSEAADLLSDKLHFVANATSVYIDNEFVFYVANDTAAVEIVSEAKAYFADANDPNVNRVYTSEKISLQAETVECDEVLNSTEAVNVLLYGSVRKGAEIDPIITVNVDRVVVETAALPYETERVENDSLARGTEQVVTAGVDGVQEITRQVVEINGEEIQSEFISSTVLQEAIPEVVEYGTALTVSYRGETGTGVFTWPIDISEGYYISSRFGWRSLGWHSGVDLADDIGTAIYASASGTVTFSDYSGGYGNLIKIDHGDGLETRYAHLDESLVSVGDYVEQGTLIALMGNTGNSTGPHLHFEIRIDGEAYDPLLYLPQ